MGRVAGAGAMRDVDVIVGQGGVGLGKWKWIGKWEKRGEGGGFACILEFSRRAEVAVLLLLLLLAVARRMARVLDRGSGGGPALGSFCLSIHPTVLSVVSSHLRPSSVIHHTSEWLECCVEIG